MNVLITRPKAKAQPLLEAITPLVTAAYHQDVIEIIPTETAIPAWLSDCDILIFVSGFAVEHFSKAIDQLPECQYLAVGQSTAELFQQQFDKPVRYPQLETSEGLLQELIEDVSDKKVGIIRGIGGRELLTEQLSELGAEVNHWEVYQRQALTNEDWLNQWKQWQIDTIIVTSVAIYQSIKQNTSSEWRQSCRWIVASERIAQALKQDGIKQIYNANGANDQAIIKQIKRTAMTQESTLETKATKKPSNAIAWLAFLLALLSTASIGAAGYYWYTIERTKQQAQNSQLAALEQSLKQEIATNNSKLLQDQTQLTQTVNQAISQNLQTVESKIDEMSGKQPHEWVLAEANYLMNMAGRKLWLEDDIDTALNLLASADISLANLNKPNLMPIREALANDIAQVRGLANPRVEDIHLTLSGLINQIELFEINDITEQEVTVDISEPQSVSDDINDWQQNLTSSVVNILKSMFYIKGGVTEGSVQPMKMPRQQWFLRANIKMAWLQAQVALLKREQQVYADNINRSLEWLNQFNSADPKVQAAKATLKTLVDTRLTAEYPKEFSSQLLLKKAMTL